MVSEGLLPRRTIDHQMVDALQIIEVGEIDRDLTLLVGHLHGHSGGEIFAE